MGKKSSQDKRQRHTTEKLTALREEDAVVPAPPGVDSLVIIYTARPHEFTRRYVLDPALDASEIGRGTQCRMMIDSVAASRRHARLTLRDGAWWIQDLDSTNGTWVNDARVTEHRLAHGDRVQIGDVIFKHLAASESESAYVEALRVALVTDGLTQTLNARAFFEELDAEIVRARDASRRVGLVLADLDHFKRVNDAHGHPAGDRVLREFIHIVRAHAPDAVIGRVGGEEFGLIPPRDALASLDAWVDDVRRAVESHAFPNEKGPLRLTASFGATVAPAATVESAVAMFERTDKLLYAAKHGGRNRACVDASGR